MIDAWERMGEIFGTVWEHNYGDANGGAIVTWTAALSVFSTTTIRASVDAMKGWSSPFPPSLGQFCEVCRQYATTNSHQDPSKQLTHQARAPQEVGERYLAQMRAITRGEYPETKDEALASLRRLK